jgi:OHCU decarboxylase
VSGLADEVYGELDRLLADADEALTAGWPGDPATRAPVQTLYLPADHPLVGPDVVDRVGASALESVEGEDAASMARITGLAPDVVAASWPRVLAKLTGQPVEDLRLDLEDGYGNRSDEDEDWDATRVGEVLAEIGGDSPPLARGVRCKSLESSTRRRGVRSLDMVVATFGGTLPPGFVMTLPKVTSVDQVSAMVLLCERLEAAHGLAERALRFEVQVETPQSVLGADGTATVARVIHAAGGRCTGLHYGTYDYSAALGVAPHHQAMDHPVADHAKDVLQVAAAQTGVRVSDGSTNVLPVGERDHVEAAWALHTRLVGRSLRRGIYQGWDLHPAQLPTRYLATFAFYRAGLDQAVIRLGDYLDRRAGGVLDEPATAYALAGFLARAIDCGAVDAAEVRDAGGPTTAEIRQLARRGGLALDALPDSELRSRLAAVCAAPRWVDLVAAARPYRTEETLHEVAAEALAALSESDIDDALAGHPRIGERGDATSQREQSDVRGDGTLSALAAGNRTYEERFGHVYLVAASGRTGEELLDVLRSRLLNDRETERRVVREELGTINRLRLDRLLEQEA